MADLVNDTAKQQLSPRNQEPSHLAGIPRMDIGGKGVQDPANSDAIRVDGAKGMSTDTSIPKSVGPEPTHLTVVTNSPVNKDDEGDGEADVVFDDEPNLQESDDLDKQLDQFEAVEPVEIDVTTKGDDDDDDDDDDKKDKKDGDKPAFMKEDDERGENNGEMVASVEKTKAAVDSGANKTPLPEEDDKMVSSDEGPQTDKSKAAPAAAMNKSGSGQVNESLKIHIKLPNMQLFESAGVPAKMQKKVGVLFESAIKDITKQISTQTQAHYKKLHEQKLARYNDVLTKQIDSYLSYVAEEWVSKNKVAVRQSLRAQLAESLLDGLKTLFTEHYVDVPQSKVDVLKNLTEEVTSLKKKVNGLTEDKLKLRRLAEAANKARIIAQFARASHLSEGQTAKLEKLAENVQYTKAAEFREKLSMLRESYFPADGKKLTTLGEEAQRGDVDAKTGKTLVEEKTDKKDGTTTDPLVAATLAASKALSNASKW